MATPSTLALLTHRIGALPIPPHDAQVLTYVGAGASDDDDIATIVYKRGGASGTTVATVTFTYVGSTNNAATIVLTVP